MPSLEHQDDQVRRMLAHPISRRTLFKSAALVGAGSLLGVTSFLAPVPAFAAGVDTGRMRQIYEQVKTPYKYGMVIPPPADGHYDSPSVFRYGDSWYMMYVVFHNNGYETLLAKSSDLLNWTPLGTILPFRANAWDTTQAAGYSALQDVTFGGSKQLLQYNNQYWLSYIGGAAAGYEAGTLSIGVASTSDPSQATPWSRLDHPVLAPYDGSVRYWEQTKLYKSNVIYDANYTLGAPYIMYYNAVTSDGSANSGVERIGMATSSDMINWTRCGNDPVLSPPDTGYPNRVVGDPQVINVGGTWVMFFWARYNGDSGTNVFNSMACSTDLVNWSMWRGEVLLTTTTPYERYQAHKPWIINDNGVTYQFYAANGDQGFGIAVATSDNLRADRSRPYAGASYTFLADSPDAAIDGIISYNDSPRSRWTAYQSPNGADWLEVRLPTQQSFSRVDLWIFTDADAIQVPRSINVEFYTPGQQPYEWTAMPNQSRTPANPTGGQNTITFSTITTDRFRIWFEHQGGGKYSGLTEVQWS